MSLAPRVPVFEELPPACVEAFFLGWDTARLRCLDPADVMTNDEAARLFALYQRTLAFAVGCWLLLGVIANLLWWRFVLLPLLRSAGRFAARAFGRARSPHFCAGRLRWRSRGIWCLSCHCWWDPRQQLGALVAAALVASWVVNVVLTTPAEIPALLIQKWWDLRERLTFKRAWDEPCEDLPEFSPNNYEFGYVVSTSSGQVALKNVMSGRAALARNRLRPRARWVRAVEEMLGGRHGCVGLLLRGRWTPDLPAGGTPAKLSYLLASIRNGVKVLGGGLYQTTSEVSEAVVARPAGAKVYLRTPYFILERHDGSVLTIMPDLLARLRQYVLFRERTDDLIGALRTRAVEWCRARELEDVVADVVVCDAVVLALECSTHEELAYPRVVGLTTPPEPPTSV